MKRVFVDTNVLLDVLAMREPHVAAAAALWSLAESKAVRGQVAAISFSNIYYIIRKASGKAAARRAVTLVRDVFEIIATDEAVVRRAIDSPIDDMEDAIQFESAIQGKADFFVTRDPKGFPKSRPVVLAPQEVLAVLKQVGSS